MGLLTFSPDPQNPPLNTRDLALRLRETRIKVLRKATVEVGATHPSGDRIGVVLVGGPTFAGKTPAPQRRVDLRHDRQLGRNNPTIERPEMDARCGVTADMEQPR